MKIQLRILNEIIRKNWMWVAIFVALVFLCLIFYAVRPTTIKLSKYDFFAVINYPKSINPSVISILLSIYQIGIVIYFVLIYYKYELEYSYANVILRINEKKWLVQKIIMIIVMLTIVNVLYIGIVYISYFKSIPFNINYVIIPLLYHILISLILVSFINIFKRKEILILILIFIISFLILKSFNIFASIFCIILLIIVNIWKFRFKKSYVY